MPVNRDEVKEIWDDAWASMNMHDITGNLAGYYYYRGVYDMCRKFFPDIDLPERVTIDND